MGCQSFELGDARGRWGTLLQGCLGLSVDAAQKRVTLTRARLPESISSLRITNLQVGCGAVDLLLERHLFNVAISVVKATGDVDIVTVQG